jgi:serine/threonine protein kinase
MIREGKLLAKVDHPNVAVVHGAERHDGRVGMWMELIRGRNLEDRLSDQGTLGAEEAAGIGRDLCRALSAVHQKGVVHRDVKTKNIMREQGGRTVLMDFGTSREAGSLEPQGTGTSGTPLYMAPELFRNRSATFRSDIYSLGVVLFRLVSGRYPVEGKSYSDVSQAHAEGKRNLLADVRPDLPEAFVRVVERALETDPRRRYATAGEFQRALAGDPIFIPLIPIESVVKAVVAIAAAVAIVFVSARLWPGPSYEVKTTLQRAAGNNTEALSPGSTIAPGDQLMLAFEGSTDLYVYVITRDDKGEAYLLFPMSRSETKNPLAAGVMHRLPGTSQGMQLHMVIVASPKRLKDFEAEILNLERPEKSGTGQLRSAPDDNAPIPKKAMVRLRGIGGIGSQVASASPEEADDIFQEVEKLEGRSESTRGPWVRRIDLEYATP